MGGPGIIEGRVHAETDNFQAVEFEIDGVTYFSAENYFQCAKCSDPSQREKVRNSGTGMDVWQAGSQVRLRKDWEVVKVREMYTGNKAKFQQNPNLAKNLVSSQGKVHFSASSSFWCHWNGLIMELLREELKPASDQNVNVIKEIWGAIEAYEKEQQANL